jgi:hypothetical protein
MDVFAEPGVMKASRAMVNVNLLGGISLSVPITCMVEVIDGSGLPRLYVAHGSDIWESTNGVDFSLFLTNSKGQILSLAAWNGYIFYPSDADIGRVPVGNAASKDDDFFAAADGVVDDNNYHPMVVQGGTLKIGNGRYVASVDESFAFTAQALKLPIGYTVKTMEVFNDYLFVGANEGQASAGISSSKATVFEWRGILPATGSALPDAIYTLNTQGIHALVSNGTDLYAFPGNTGAAWVFTGAGFVKLLDVFPDQTALRPGISIIEIFPNSVAPFEGSLLYSGQFNNQHGVYQIKDGRFTQALVPSFVTPGELSSNVRQTAFLRSAFLDNIYLSTWKANTFPAASEYFFQSMSTNRQNNAMMRTLWHRIGTDRFKRFGGIRLNLKPMPANTAVSIAYRTGRTDSFTNAPHTVTAANQNKPVLFPVRPKGKEIQFRLTFTTSGSTTPELTSYDVLFDALNSTR